MAVRPSYLSPVAAIEQCAYLPFLYRTRTILQTYTGPRQRRICLDQGQSLPARSQKAFYSNSGDGGRRRGGGAVPFDEDTIAKVDRNRVNTSSSVTTTEARIFQGLLGLQKRDEAPVTEETKDKPSLSSVVGQATGVSFGDDNISRIIQEYLADQKSREGTKDSDLRDQDKSGGILRHITDLMNGAQSDARLWQIFHEQVTEKVLALDLDNPDHDQSNPEARDLFLKTIQPSIRLYYEIMERNFSTSPYALALLPKLKELPISSFAVLAGIELYNHHMELLYRQRLDLRGIFRALDEMEANIIPFNKKTFLLLDDILNTSKLNLARPWTSAGYFWSNDGFKIALPKLKYWHDRVGRETKQQAKRQQHDDQLVGFS